MNRSYHIRRIISLLSGLLNLDSLIQTEVFFSFSYLLWACCRYQTKLSRKRSQPTTNKQKKIHFIWYFKPSEFLISSIYSIWMQCKRMQIFSLAMKMNNELIELLRQFALLSADNRAKKWIAKNGFDWKLIGKIVCGINHLNDALEIM